MNIKSLLLGSAVAAVAATGARAADAIIIAEPEPMEYVRICDVYGAGFFYIPGTETCLRIGGYLRYEMRYTDYADAGEYTFGKFSRFQLNVDARSETEWGTLRSYAEGRFDWTSITNTNAAYLNQGFIELQQANGTIRLGKSDTPYARFLGYGSPFGPFDASYGFYNSGELSYTYNGGNGFSAIAALVEIAGNNKFDVGVEGGVNFAQGWGNVGAIAGYDTLAEEWGAKLVANGNFGAFSVGGHLFYSSGFGSIYNIGSGIFGNALTSSEFSALVYAKAKVTDTLAIAGAFQWFDAEHGAVGVDHAWEVTGGLDWTPVAGLRIRPEVQYGKIDTVIGNEDAWRATVRFDRSF
jgi:hypothetical protein